MLLGSRLRDFALASSRDGAVFAFVNVGVKGISRRVPPVDFEDEVIATEDRKCLRVVRS